MPDNYINPYLDSGHNGEMELEQAKKAARQAEAREDRDRARAGKTKYVML